MNGEVKKKEKEEREEKGVAILAINVKKKILTFSYFRALSVPSDVSLSVFQRWTPPNTVSLDCGLTRFQRELPLSATSFLFLLFFHSFFVYSCGIHQRNENELQQEPPKNSNET